MSPRARLREESAAWRGVLAAAVVGDDSLLCLLSPQQQVSLVGQRSSPESLTETTVNYYYYYSTSRPCSRKRQQRQPGGSYRPDMGTIVMYLATFSWFSPIGIQSHINVVRLFIPMNTTSNHRTGYYEYFYIIIQLVNKLHLIETKLVLFYSPNMLA